MIRCPAVLIVSAALLTGTLLGQQPKVPDVGCLYPAGMKQGESLDVIAGGQHLDQAKEVIISGDGIRGRITGFSRPLPGKKFQEFRELLAARRKEMMDMAPKQAKHPKEEDIGPTLREAGATDEEIRLFLIMRKQRNDPKRQDNRQLEESVTIRIEADPNAAPGPRTLRVIGKNGLSNPMIFHVGDYPEVREPPATELAPPPPQPLNFPVVINGQILPGETDAYSFRAARGEHIVFIGQARALIPYLADAVPGWFQMVLTLFDSKDNKVAEARSFHFSPDPVLVFDVKEAGTYRLEVRDALHRGREDFVYRITAGQIPFAYGISPLGAPCGTPATVEIFGFNLPAKKTVVKAPDAPGTYPGLVRDCPQALFESAEGGEIASQEPDNDPGHAPLVRTPATINGCIDKPGDTDVFSVRADHGKPLVIEVMARRLGSPLDSFIKVTDVEGNGIAGNDDYEDPSFGLLTHHADSKIVFDAPSDGIYYIWIGDAQHAGGPDYPYRLRVGPPRYDFELQVAPSGISGAPGANLPFTVNAVRKDGFDGEITLACDTPGYVISGGKIPAGADSVTATIVLPAQSATPVQRISIAGEADAGGTRIRRTAVPADDMLQAFIYHHLVPAGELLAFTPADAKSRPTLGVDSAPLVLKPGESARIKCRIPQHLRDGSRVVLQDPPDGVAVAGISMSPHGFDIALLLDASKLKAGSAGNLVFEVMASKPDKKDPSKTNTWSAGYLPAVPYQVAADF